MNIVDAHEPEIDMSAGAVVAFRRLYNAHYAGVWAYCVRRADNMQHAEDAVSETFIVAWQQLSNGSDDPNSRPWLFAVARNKLRESRRGILRRNGLLSRLGRPGAHDFARDPAEVGASSVQHVFDALDHLDADEQELLRLVAWEELPYVEIAQILDISENAVAIRIHRARTKLRSRLEDHPFNNTTR